MGCGPGPGRGIPLSEYQQENPDDITVIGDNYTFVANHTILAEEEIIFGATDTLNINAGVDVILEGKLYVIDETDGITRITVNGTLTMDEGSEIEICGIRNGGIGIFVNTGGRFTQNGGDIRITTVDGTGANSVGIIVTGAGAVFNAFDGTIQIGTVRNNAVGIGVVNDGAFTQNGTDITITNVANLGIGIVVVKNSGVGSAATFTQTAGNITINTVDGTGANSVGILVTGAGAVFNANAGTGTGTIQIGTVTNASGIEVRNDGLFTQNGTDITITNVTNFGHGIQVLKNSGVGSAATYTQTTGDITIMNVDGTGANSVGILVTGAGAVFNANAGTGTGTIQIGTVRNNAVGIGVVNDGAFTQNGTDITITNVINSGSGILVVTTGAGLTATFTQTTGDIR
jgi:hypothetical protein